MLSNRTLSAVLPRDVRRAFLETVGLILSIAKLTAYFTYTRYLIFLKQKSRWLKHAWDSKERLDLRYFLNTLKNGLDSHGLVWFEGC